MTRDELIELVAEIRGQQSELQDVEVKAARGGTPRKALKEALSALANRPGGGIIVFGLDEERGFEVCGVYDAQRLQEEIGHAAANELEPPIRPEFCLAQVDGKAVVAAEIPETPVLDKPCHIKAGGLQGGAFIRTGLANRHMTTYEIFGYVGAREQPVFDAEPVGAATLDDLDRTKLDGYLARLRRDRPDAEYLRHPIEQVLVQLGVVKTVDGVHRPTLAGLLAFGRYPQSTEPQLVITFLQFFGTDASEPGPRGERFIDNRKFEGTVAEIIDATVLHILASIRKSSLIDGLFRRDIPEYPEVAIREAVINAVAHRDYSPMARGSFIQVRLFADHLEIQSPGGLHGPVTTETIEDERSSRNRLLVRFLEDLHLVENRGSGVRTMIRAMRDANLEPPVFEDRRVSFWVTFRNHTLMDPATIAWLNRFAGLPLSDHQRVALAFLRRQDRITNPDYRRLNYVDMLTATRDLRGLVQAGLLVQHGIGRGTYYEGALLDDAAGEMPSVRTLDDQVIAYVREHGMITNAMCQRLLALDSDRSKRLLGRLTRSGTLRREGSRRWSSYRLP